MDDNKRLFEWLNPDGCWHDFGGEAEKDTEICAKCGYRITFIWGGTRDKVNPDYSTESGFFALLDGLEKKGWHYNLLWDDCMPKDKREVFLWKTDGTSVTDQADTLREALRQAAIKAMESEQPTGGET